MKKYILIAAVFATTLFASAAMAQRSPTACIDLFIQSPYGAIPAGSTTTITWRVDYTRCRAVKITGGGISKVIVWGDPDFRVGSLTTGPLTAKTTFKMDAFTAAPPAPLVVPIDTASTVVFVTPAVCKINSFTATPTSVPVGTASSLAWNTSGCTSVSISGGGMSGSKPLSSTGLSTGALSAPVTYTLSATGTSGTVTSTAAVTVTSTTVCPSSTSGTRDLLHGYAWSSTIGWISLNCAEGGLTGLSDYKVAVDPATGLFSGHAWSPNVGWISFQAPDVVTQCGPVAKLNLSTNQVSGWARVVSGSTASGADGCITFSTWGGTAHQVTYDPDSTTPVMVGGTALPGHILSGFAFGDVNVGWIDFNYATLDSTYAGGTIDLKVNGVDGPITTTDETGGPVTLSWTTTAMTTCSAVPDTFDPSETYWRGGKATAGTLAISVPPNTTSATISHVYGLSCTGVSGTVSDTVQVDVPPPGATATVVVDVVSDTAPTLTFLADGVVAETIVSGTPVNLTWAVGSQATCTGTSTSGTSPYGSWSGTPKTATPDGTYAEVVTGITTNSTFTMRCTGLDSSVTTQTVTITISGDTGGGTGGTRRPPWQEF